MRWGRAFVIAVLSGVAAATLWVSVLGATKTLPPGSLGLEETSGFSLVIFVGALIVARVWGERAFEGRTEAVVFEGTATVAPGAKYTVIPLELRAGDEVHGSVAELKSRLVRLILRSRKTRAAARKGNSVPLLKDWTGTADSNWWAQPAPSTQAYDLEIQSVGDDSGREVQVLLRKRGGQ